MLPPALRDLFRDQDFDRLSWDCDSDAIAARVLSAGEGEAITWLRRTMGDPALRAWIARREGRGLDARRLRYWQIVLDLPEKEVERWLAAPGRAVREGRELR